VTVHKVPAEPTSDRVPCCGALLADLNPVTDPLTRVDRDVTCKADELGDLELSPILRALVDSTSGKARERLVGKLREIKSQPAADMRAQADALLETAGLTPHFADNQPDHGEEGHVCIPPEILMQVQDSLGQVLSIVNGHRARLLEAEYPEPVVYSMVANLHAVLLQRMI
jgi:hypothetical protein